MSRLGLSQKTRSKPSLHSMGLHDSIPDNLSAQLCCALVMAVGLV